ncbi:MULTISPECIES: flagellar hook assembly protein FlgD [unclassified Devosia]|uniref:flagellar hook assembly protein FlgD n=1 Tax=unclassified Devosia TaxID=196773 RepID=UPI000926134F|nr:MULTISPECIES: flagellar hook assembly protein FlgD [unclassified Devosia]MBL8597285.1 flagellar hook assembly protein FlgD [Devosia sp.]OJX53051.1 MAG: flagellar hook capping protein [Devosia sp. 66-22]
MAVDGVGSTGSSNPSISGSRAGIADNFDTFLQLLTAQLKNQNPLDPLDTNAFTQQLVQFSSVEQQLKTNDFLSALVQANTNSVQTNAVAYIGKTVAADGVRSELVNGKAVWNFSLEDAATATVTIKDKDGNVVYTEKGNLQAGQGQFTWNGKTSTGGKAPDGSYTISMTGINAEGKTVPISTQFTGVVTGVDFTGSEPVLLIGSTRVNLSTVKAITATPPAQPPDDTETPDTEGA